MADQRDHDLGQRRLALGRHPRRAGQDGARLHPHDVRDQDAQPHAAHAEHGVDLAHGLDRRQQLFRLGQLAFHGRAIGGTVGRGGLALTGNKLHRSRRVLLAEDLGQALLQGRTRLVGHGIDLDRWCPQQRAQAGHLLQQLVVRRQELVQRRVDQADHDRQAIHRPEEPGEVIGLQDLELCQGRVEGGDRLAVVGGQLVAGVAPMLGLGGPSGVEDHALHGRQPLLLEEHVLGPAQADALRPEGSGTLGVARVVRVGPDLQAPDLIGPGQERGQVVLVLVARLDGGQLPGEDLAGGAVDADHVALVDGDLAGLHLAPGVVDLQRLGPGHAGQAHRARHHRRVAGGPAAGREHATGRQHAVHVVRAGLDAHQDHRVAGRLGLHRPIRVEDRLAGGRARRGVEALRQEAVRRPWPWPPRRSGAAAAARSGPGRPAAPPPGATGSPHWPCRPRSSPRRARCAWRSASGA